MDGVTNVPVLNIESRKSEADSNSTKKGEGNEKWKEQNARAGQELVPDHESRKNKQGDEKIE